MRAVVTGAASGIGRAVARRFAADAAARGEQAELVLVDRAADGLAAVADELGAGASTVVVDLARTDSGEVVAAAARERFDGLDAVISNAGVVTAYALNELSEEEYERTFAINTRATWLLAKATYPLLREAKGALVATASLASIMPVPPMGAYSASKAALVMIVSQLAYEWGPDGIRCNCVSPGMTHTGLTEGSYSDPELKAERGAKVPLQRIGTAEDIAAVIAFLAGPDASYVTGVNVYVDGGLSTVLMPAIRGITPA